MLHEIKNQAWHVHQYSFHAQTYIWREIYQALIKVSSIDKQIKSCLQDDNNPFFQKTIKEEMTKRLSDLSLSHQIKQQKKESKSSLAPLFSYVLLFPKKKQNLILSFLPTLKNLLCSIFSLEEANPL